MAEAPPDFRSQRSPSPEGKGIARRAWDAYAAGVQKAVQEAPGAQPLLRRIAAPMAVDLFGFWLCWHLEGGYEGLRAAGMSRSAIYRRLRAFRNAVGVHPDEYEMPGVTIDVAKYQEGSLRL